MDLDETMTTSTSSTSSILQDNAEVEGSLDGDNLSPEAGGGVGVGIIDHPQTPPTHNPISAAAPGELSPPQSQPHSQSDEGSAPTTRATAAASSAPKGGHGHGHGHDHPRVGANIAAARAAARSTPTAGPDAQRDEAAASQPPGNERDERPGWGWKSKKAQDEMQRAWDNIVDRDFSLKEYGDVVMRGKEQLAQQ
ncbi:hypothetical protein A1O3_05947 [Capronia epimyces CBS 606.96]|uniref:Uncharacterized protein n=1 Tax=Capronia epimyces CBS 606.96 TaxID=1182542 RepID=W9XXJ3_9EURO|nr:uncharacterized protein A1O3_05947 [Capronia epimyces CBS 606.96]EXJ85272.1 hypothetical protein A1O3_05947 [Capronia epimyces CBS 606.96]